MRKIAPHAAYSALLARMKLAATDFSRGWKGTIFRASSPKWANSHDLVSGIGSKMSGARFNAPGSFCAVYGSTTPELAMIESVAFQRRAQLPLEDAMPLVFKAVNVTVLRLLDLTDDRVLENLVLSPRTLREDRWWEAQDDDRESLSQALGRAACACGIQALMAASARTPDHGVNIVVFPDHILPPSVLQVHRRRPRAAPHPN